EERALGRLASLRWLKNTVAGRGGRASAGSSGVGGSGGGDLGADASGVAGATSPVIVITGCIAQKDGATLLERFPQLDVVIGTRDWPHLISLIERAMAGERIAAVGGIDQPLEHGPHAHRHSRVKASVEAMVGCDNYCSYCVVPYTRGREQSRPFGAVIADLERLVAEGYKEVLLVGQNVNSYRDGQAGLADLLRHANAVAGLERIRFITSNPHDLSDAIIEAMASLPKVCESLHLPAQAGSDRVLKRMNRRYTRAQYEALAARLRAAVPGIALSTDLLVGFPGETQEDYEQTLAMQASIRWDAAFTFMYSPREGTEAWKLPDDVPAEEKQRRVAELIQRQEAISAEINAALVGQTCEALVENASRRDASELIGRTRSDKPVVFPGGENLIGRLVPVRITQTSGHTLRGVNEE
ncbi:MAG: tRNA (N6-isopentenyl adenosine(37)-C2)-methylthiotransferase MiaB, partial [Candidatus Sumerlaeota bacterium]|nr:tRNA (N6-isopentenyl adenosine(37)-C2)-methylthiotransferase MiaB [Candidatus Sumerlaeota bacterium]